MQRVGVLPPGSSDLFIIQTVSMCSVLFSRVLAVKRDRIRARLQQLVR